MTTESFVAASDSNSLQQRFNADNLSLPADAPELHRQLAARGVVRSFTAEPVPSDLLRRLCALALCAPTKSDLQQRDIIIVDDAALNEKILAPLAEGRIGQPWLKSVPALLIFCGNNRRQRLWHDWRGIPFANDHLDAFFNAGVDAGIALTAFVLAAEAQGLGTCPISAIRNRAQAISDLLHLPQHVFPVAGLAVGWPSSAPKQSMRLPLDVTVHRNGYSEDGLREAVEDYDRRREAAQPYREQRYVDQFGKAERYGWSEDKARQYAVPERADFGAYIRARGFKLD
jgi:nitroreductase